MTNPYEDIMNLPHHRSEKHPQMKIEDRAAQFAPFAALTGYDSAVKETARLTEDRQELSEEKRAELDRKHHILLETIEDHPQVAITYFVPDEKKSGGKYVTTIGNLKWFDDYHRTYIMMDGTEIKMRDVMEMEEMKKI